MSRWDTRQKGSATSHKAHDQEVMAVAFCPADGNLIITGSADKVMRTVEKIVQM